MKLPFLQGERRDAVVFAVALIVLTMLLVLVSDGGVLFSRPLWADEIQTMMVASHASPLAVLSDLIHGADHGPPLLHLSVWVADRIGLASPVALRVTSLACVLAALVVVYVTLRRQWTTAASEAGALAVGAHSLVIAQAFEARYYGPWLLFTALFAWCVGLPDTTGHPRRHRIALGAIAALLCMSHWYGIITLTLMCGGVLLSYGRRWRDGLRRLAPSLAGFAALALLVPLAFKQRGSLTINTWVPDFNARQLDVMAYAFWTAMLPSAAVLVLIVAAVADGRKDGAYEFGAIAGRASRDPSLVALASLALLPIALAAVSIMGQPSVFPRYAIPAALAWAALVGLSLETAGRRVARLFVVLVVAVWVVNFVRLAQIHRNFADRTTQQTAELRRAEALGVPIVFQSMHTLYAVVAHDWPRRSAGQANFLELPDSTLANLFPRGIVYQVNKTFVVERDIARVHSRRFGFPALVPQATLDTTSQFVLFLDDTEFPRGYTPETLTRALFPRHQARRLTSSLWLLQRGS